MEKLSLNVVAERSTRTDYMSVSEKELIKMIPELRPYAWIFYTDPASVEDLREIFLASKLWRMNNLYMVQTKDGEGGDVSVLFRMKPAQLVLYAQLNRHPRVVVLKSRQIGISTVTVLLYIDDMIIIPNLKIGIVAQNQDAANGLKDKISFAFREMDSDVKAFFGVRDVVDNDKSFGLSNGSIATARLSFRSGTLHRFAWTEVGKIANSDPARITETLSGSMQAIAPVPSNWVVNESTAEGNNYFKHLFDSAVEVVDKPITNKEVRPLFFSWLIDKTCNSDILVEISDEVAKIVNTIESEFSDFISSPLYRNQLGNFIYPDDFQYKMSDSQQSWLVGALKELDYDMELFYREYPHTPKSAFYVSSDAVWYKNALARLVSEGRLVKSKPSSIVSDLYNPDYEVWAVTDIGYEDTFSIIYVQIIGMGLYTDSGLEIWDIRVLGYDEGHHMKTDKYAEMIHKQPYHIKTVVIPHDGARNTVLKDSVSVEDDFYQLGFNRVITLDRPAKIMPYILEVRQRLGHTRIDATKAYTVFDGLSNYKKKYDKVMGRYTDVPVHDWASHPSDAFRYVCSVPYTCERVRAKRAMPKKRGKLSI